MSMEEELRKALEEMEELTKTVTELSQRIDDKDAEIKSLTDENTLIKEEMSKKEEELKNTKAMNFTLARNMNVKTETFEDALLGLMGVQKK